MTTVPMCFVSLTIRASSAERIDSNRMTLFTSRLVHLMREKSAKVLTRGHATSSFLRSLGIEDVHVAGCPSIFYLDPTSVSSFSVDQVMTCGYLPWPGTVGLPYKQILGHIVQGDGLEARYRDRRRSRFRSSYHPHYLDRGGANPTTNGVLDWAVKKRRAIFPNSLNHWQTALRSASCLLGSRLHGSILALSSGTPALCTGADVRTAETLEVLGQSSINIAEVTDLDSLITIGHHADDRFKAFPSAVADARAVQMRLLKEFLG